MPATKVRFSPDAEACLPGSNGRMLSCVTFTTCPGNRLYLAPCGAKTSYDASGVSPDGWWAVTSRGLPDRYYRIRGGSSSLHAFLRRFAFLDKEDCVHHKEAILVYDTGATSFGDVPVCTRAREMTGVPQFYANSGVCWFASLCWVLLANEYMKALILPYFPSKMHADVHACLFDRDAAERFRKYLWYDLHVGDDVERDPLEDGQNGGGEFLVMCAALGIPLFCYECTNRSTGRMKMFTGQVRDKSGRQKAIVTPCPSAPHLLVLRFEDGNHEKVCPIKRSIVLGGRSYMLVGCFLGQRKCGHQIALACVDMEEGLWGVTDADAHKDGTGPMFCRIPCSQAEHRWWEAWRYIVSLTRFTGKSGRDFCPLSPWNIENSRYDAYRGSLSGATNSIDCVYVPR